MVLLFHSENLFFIRGKCMKVSNCYICKMIFNEYWGSKEAVSMIDTAVETINSFDGKYFILRILMEKTI